MDFYKKIGTKIKKIRESLGLSQEFVATKLGIERIALSRIENGKRKITAQELKMISELFNISIDALLDEKKEIEVLLEEGKKKDKKKQRIRISVPQKNVQKFKEVLLYILNKVGAKPNVGETVIYKLLYFIDFDFYEKYEEQLIGATYIKNHFGPTPVEFIKIVEEMEGKDIIKVEDKYYSYPQNKYLPLRAPDLSILKANELEVIDSVLNKLADKNASEISEYSHKDIPWLTAEEGEVIDYEAVFYRTPEYSVRSYNEKEERDKF